MSPSRLRALNTPAPVSVELDARGLPAKVGARVVEAIGEVWRIDDEWWRRLIARRYVEVMLEGGGRSIVFEDLVTGDWWEQGI